jgi:D-beta-D-heptose 7-phosphate kinase/D-beta-D-heptose 1-phosphate adenosyltransferase
MIKIPDYSKVKLHIVGDVMLDRYWFGKTTRISPEAPVPIVSVNESNELPGGAGNVANNIAQLGCKVTLMAPTGDDDIAEKLEKELKKSNVECKFQVVSKNTTTTKLRVLSQNQQLIRIDFEGGLKDFNASKLSQMYEKTIHEADAIVFSDYNKGALKNIEELIEKANALNKPIFVDPKGKEFKRYKNATVLTPNLSEFEAVAGISQSEEELTQKAHTFVKNLKLEAMLLTRSEKGMSLFKKDGETIHVPSETREVYDVTGAGDTVVSVLSASYAAGSSLSDAMYLSNIAAGIVIGKLGAATVSLSELEKVTCL